MEFFSGPGSFVSRCVFVDGQHVYAGPDCPHVLDRDEEGEKKPLGWTVQHG